MTPTIVPPTSADDPAILCAIPVYNNAATIVDIVRRCLQQTPHVLVIDDGSTDADLRNLLKPLDVAVIGHPLNQGKGKALLKAFHYAAERGVKYLITLDGDGQHFPEDIPHFAANLKADTILLGYRDQVSGDMPPSSYFGREFSDFWVYVETGRIVCDSQSGFRAYPVPAALQLTLTSRFYNFEIEILAKALWAGMRAESVPIRVFYPPATDRVSHFHPIRDNWRISILHARVLIRQLLPIPHRRLLMIEPERRAEQTPSLISTRLMTICAENSGPLGLALVMAPSIIMTIVLWPWGILPIAYLTVRFHLNKLAALACVALCSAPALHAWCGRLGNALVRSDIHPHLSWFVGSHLVAIPLAGVVAGLAYRTARRFDKLVAASDCSHKICK